MLNIIKNNSGQGMMELLVAIFVIVMGIVAVLALSISTIVAGRESIKTVEAANLAREGLEVVRNIRDSNWVKIEAGQVSVKWDSGLTSLDPSDKVAVAEFDPTTGEWLLDFDNTNFQLKRSTDGIYLYADSPADGQLTGYSRWIEITKISGEDGYKVKSIMEWQERGKTRTISAEEDLYNWRS